MDAATTTIIIGLATTLVGAIAYALRQRGNADRERGKAERIRAETERTQADTTGRVLVGAEADAAQVRQWVADLRARLDRCERRHEACDARVERMEREHAEELRTKDAQIAALWKECGALRAAIEGGR
jgi:predicted RNase H-like nuclease (RuvC/YqgF family)